MNNNDSRQPHRLIGGGSYDNLMTYQLVVEKERVSLRPVPIPWSVMVAYNCVFFVFFAVAFYLASLRDNPLWVFCFVVVLAVLTCALFDAVVFYRFKKSLRRGEILVCNRITGEISLPDRGLDFTTHDDIYIECITSREVGAADYEDCNSELNFVYSRDGEVKRWNLLRSIATVKPFGKLPARLRHQLPIPVRRV